jgi:hypothetical protein
MQAFLFTVDSRNGALKVRWSGRVSLILGFGEGGAFLFFEGVELGERCFGFQKIFPPHTAQHGFPPRASFVVFFSVLFCWC